MAFFAESTVKEDQNLLDITVNEYTDFDALALEACDTIQEMDNAIMQGIGRYELSQVTEGAEVVYTEGMAETIKAKLSKIWDFIKKWVKSVWNKFITWIGSYIKGDKEFVSKYEKQIKENVKYLKDDYTYELKYGTEIFDKADNTISVDEVKSEFSAAVSKIYSTEVDKLDDLVEKYKDGVNDALENLKDSKSNRVEVNTAFIKNNLIKIIECIKEDTSKYNKLKSDCEKAINDMAKTADGKFADFPATAPKKVAAYKSMANICTKATSRVVSLILEIIKYRKSAARAICRKILTAKPNPKYNESTAFEHTDFDSYFTI